MSGYCQAGKCECKHMRLDGIYCEADKALEGLRLIVSFEQCPWPSHQVRVEPPKENFLRDQYKTMHDAGIAEGIRRCREAVGKVVVKNLPDGTWYFLYGDILAAIDAVKEE